MFDMRVNEDRQNEVIYEDAMSAVDDWVAGRITEDELKATLIYMNVNHWVAGDVCWIGGPWQ